MYMTQTVLVKYNKVLDIIKLRKMQRNYFFELDKQDNKRTLNLHLTLLGRTAYSWILF